MNDMRLKQFFALVVAVVMLAGSALGQTVRNEVGIYTDLSADPAATSITVQPYEPFTLYLMVINPYNDSVQADEDAVPTERPISMVGGFYIRILLPEEGLLRVGETPNSDIWVSEGNPPDYCFGFYPGIQVPEDGRALLMSMEYMVTDSEPRVIYLAPAQVYPHEGEFLILDASSDPPDFWHSAVAGYPVSGSFANPVFGINTQVVATSNASWDQVKALYR